jgi:eukaryotic-like serine/threonine-protein kinase
MARTDQTPRDLLFGLLALQIGLIDQDQLVHRHARLHEPRAGRWRPGKPGTTLRRLQPGRHSPKPRQVDPSIDKALEAVCLKAMATIPEDRHATARALADDIDRWAADEPPSSAGRTADAIALHESTLRLRESKLGPDHPHEFFSRTNLALAYEAVQRWADAEALHRENVTRRRKTEKPGSHLLAGDLGNLGGILLKQAKWSEAEPLLRASPAIRVKMILNDHRRFNVESLFGGVLFGQEKYAEAEPLVVGGYEGMKARQARE